jgi:hypothetical protein
MTSVTQLVKWVLGAKFDLPVLGAVNYKYYPRYDSTKNTDNNASGDQSGSVGSAQSVSLKTDMGGLPFVGGYLDGLTLTTGLGEIDHTTILNADDAFDATAALNYSVGAFKLGYQKKLHNEGEASATADAVWYKDDIIGVAYAYSDAISISFNRYTSYKHDNTGAPEQETDAINVGYTMGGMTIGFQEAQTDNAGYVLATSDDTRTLGVSVAF